MQRTGEESDVVSLISGDTLEGRVDVGVTGGGEVSGRVSAEIQTRSVSGTMKKKNEI